MPRPPRKKPAKYDHAELQQSFVASPPTEAEARTATQAWLRVPENIERLLEAVASGQSVRRFCERERISYSPVQRALTSPELEPRYRGAQEQQGEHLLGEMERITAKLESGELDPKTGSVILDSLKWRMSKFNARYNDRQVIEQHQFNHTQAHIEAVRALARMTSVRQLGSATYAHLVHQADSAPRLELETERVPVREPVLEGELILSRAEPEPDPRPDPEPPPRPDPEPLPHPDPEPLPRPDPEPEPLPRPDPEQGEHG